MSILTGRDNKLHSTHQFASNCRICHASLSELKWLDAAEASTNYFLLQILSHTSNIPELFKRLDQEHGEDWGKPFKRRGSMQVEHLVSYPPP